MLKYFRAVVSTLLISATLFLVACTGSITEAGDRLEGKGSATISQNGEIEGQGEGKSHSKEDGDHDDDDDHDNDHHSHRKLKFKMKNPTDKIVCTSATGQVTVYGRGDDINKTATATCVVTPASQVPATTTASSSSSGTSGTSGGTSGATTTTTTGSNTASSSAASSTSATPNPANSF
jgi:hypothetical protein